VKRHANDPFVLLGIDTDENKAEFAKRAHDHGVTWRNSLQGAPQNASTPKAWAVDGYPTNYVIDARGRIRSVGLRGEALERQIETLIAEARSGTTN
jgi:hypothetical protein